MPTAGKRLRGSSQSLACPHPLPRSPPSQRPLWVHTSTSNHPHPHPPPLATTRGCKANLFFHGFSFLLVPVGVFDLPCHPLPISFRVFVGLSKGDGAGEAGDRLGGRGGAYKFFSAATGTHKP